LLADEHHVQRDVALFSQPPKGKGGKRVIGGHHEVARFLLLNGRHSVRATDLKRQPTEDRGIHGGRINGLRQTAELRGQPFADLSRAHNPQSGQDRPKRFARLGLLLFGAFDLHGGGDPQLHHPLQDRLSLIQSQHDVI
jgi:hypothetical protein